MPVRQLKKVNSDLRLEYFTVRFFIGILPYWQIVSFSSLFLIIQLITSFVGQNKSVALLRLCEALSK